MKNSLGKIVIFLLSLSVLYGEDFSHKMQVGNQTPYVKEATVLTLELNQTNADMVLLFNFDLKKSDDYEFIRLDSVEEDAYHNAYFKYIYLLYPLKSGEIEVEFNLIKKVTTDESIAYSYSGDRDNVKTLVTKDTPIILPSLFLNVKAIPKDTLLVGDFKLTHTLKNYNAKAYEPIPFNITLKGRGYPPLMQTILTQKGEFTRFTEKPIVVSKATLNGTKNKIIYPIALSHKESFSLSPLVLKAFNPKTEKSYELTMPKQQFEIEKVAIEELIDSQNSPDKVEQDLSWSWSWIGEILSYILTFVAGYIVAIALKWQRKKSKKESSSLELKIKKSKDAKELFQLLMATNNRKFDLTIKLLEGALYRGEKIDFKEIKHKLIEI